MGSGVLGGHLELSGLLSRIMQAVVGWRTENWNLGVRYGSRGKL